MYSSLNDNISSNLQILNYPQRNFLSGATISALIERTNLEIKTTVVIEEKHGLLVIKRINITKLSPPDLHTGLPANNEITQTTVRNCPVFYSRLTGL